jgi:DNA-binding transcriptional LysR family regulator
MSTLRALECLVAVVEEGSFTRAAARLGVTQPALSHQLASLEREFGGVLVERATRGRRGAVPTAAGRAALPHARRALAAAARAGEEARSASGARRGVLRIACAQSVTVGVLPPALLAWHRRRPDVRFRLTEHRSADELAEQVRTGDADLGIGPRPSAWEGLAEVLGDEELLLAVAAGDELAGRGAVGPAELAHRTWVHYDPGHGLAGVVDGLCAAAGFTPVVAVRTTQTAAVPVLAATGVGVALVPATAVPPRWPGALLRLDPPVRRELVVLRRGGDDPLAGAFARTLLHRGLPMAATVLRALET